MQNPNSYANLFFYYELYSTLYSFPGTLHVNPDGALHYENQKNQLFLMKYPAEQITV